MMREVAELANVDRSALWHQLVLVKMRIFDYRGKTEVSNFAGEKSALAQRLSESDAANNRFKSEMRADTDRSNQEEELSGQMCDIENQLEWKLLQDRDAASAVEIPETR